jgi:hypothetical protein
MRDTPARPAAAGPSTRLSADGSHWWDGAGWQPATSPDGLWRWDGAAWSPAVPIDPEDPAAVADLFDILAGQRFAAGGRLLAARHTEWEPQSGEVAEVVMRAAPLAQRLAALDAQLAGREPAPPGLGGFLSRLGGGERPAQEVERSRLEEELRPLAALLGRMAPQPSLPEADEMLGSGRHLEERALGLQRARAELEARETEQRARVEAAAQQVAQAQAAREAALAEIEARVRAAELEREQAVEELTLALRGLRMPGPGAELARLHGAVLYGNRIETPDGRGPVPGAEVHTGTAPELWAGQRQALAELLLLETTGAARFHESLAAGGDEGYALVITRHVRSIVPYPPGAEAEAAEFARQVTQAAGPSGGEHRRWHEQVRGAEEALEVAIGDSSRVEAARADLERAVADPELQQPVREAEKRLRAAEKPPAALEAARAAVRAAVEDLLKPPAPLQAAGS